MIWVMMIQRRRRSLLCKSSPMNLLLFSSSRYPTIIRPWLCHFNISSTSRCTLEVHKTIWSSVLSAFSFSFSSSSSHSHPHPYLTVALTLTPILASLWYGLGSALLINSEAAIWSNIAACAITANTTKENKLEKDQFPIVNHIGLSSIRICLGMKDLASVGIIKKCCMSFLLSFPFSSSPFSPRFPAFPLWSMPHAICLHSVTRLMGR